MDPNAALSASEPLYRLQEKERWSTAAMQFQEMLSSSGLATPNNSQTSSGCGSSHDVSQPASSEPRPINEAPVKDLFVRPRSWSGDLDTAHRGWQPASASLSGSRLASRGESAHNTLELEAIAAVHELAFAVEAIYVSDILPRTPELIFLNITTVEGKPYCLELTNKGWRVTSQRHDSMTGDYTQLELHTKYFENPYALMEHISTGYQTRFGERLAARLALLSTGVDAPPAPPSSFVAPSTLADDLHARLRLDNAAPPIAVRHPSSDSPLAQHFPTNAP